MANAKDGKELHKPKMETDEEECNILPGVCPYPFFLYAADMRLQAHPFFQVVLEQMSSLGTPSTYICTAICALVDININSPPIPAPSTHKQPELGILCQDSSTCEKNAVYHYGPYRTVWYVYALVA